MDMTSEWITAAEQRGSGLAGVTAPPEPGTPDYGAHISQKATVPVGAAWPRGPASPCSPGSSTSHRASSLPRKLQRTPQCLSRLPAAPLRGRIFMSASPRAGPGAWEEVGGCMPHGRASRGCHPGDGDVRVRTSTASKTRSTRGPWSPWQPGPPPSQLSSACTRPGDQARRDSFPQGRSLGCPGGGGTCLLGFLALWWVGSWSLPSED